MLLVFTFLAPLAFAAGGPCPANSPLSGQNSCYFVSAQSGASDTNSGTSESSPWLHAPGMPNCTGKCASLNAGNGGIGIILRGGDTWHLGNSGSSPYTGGTWDLYGWYSNAYTNTSTGCGWELTNTTCLYVGVDTTWYSGSSWARPILTGDNPIVSGFGNFASGCAYQIANPGGNWGTNLIVTIPAWTIFDSFELTGGCVSNPVLNGEGYVAGFGYGNSASNLPQSILENIYIHGWSATRAAGTTTQAVPVTLIGSGGVFQDFDKIVVDGSDSNPEVSAWATFPSFFHMRDSLIQYTGQGVGSSCHDIHDNILQHMYYTELSGHYNALECNSDYEASGTANVFYNNVIRHFDPSFGSGEVLWFCPNTTPEYWFNDLEYDVVGQVWAVAGAPLYSDCTGTGGQFWFNSTFVDAGSLACHGSGSDTSGGAYRSIYNLHMINTTFDASGCTGYSDSSNVKMSDATATTQGYTTGSSGTAGTGNTCANDSTTPCASTAPGNSTVGTGHNLTNNSSLADAVTTTWCAKLATYTGEPAISVDAFNACKYGTTDGCSYNSTTHAMICPAQKAAARPASGAWDAGAYQFANVGTPGTPLNLTAIVK